MDREERKRKNTMVRYGNREEGKGGKRTIERQTSLNSRRGKAIKK